MDTLIPIELEKSIALVEQQGNALLSSEELASVASFIKDRIQPLRKEIADTFDELIQDAYQLHRKQLAMKKKHDEPLAQLEAKLRALLSDQHERYRLEGEEIREYNKLVAANSDPDEPVALVPVPVAPEMPGVDYREVFDFELLDIDSVKPDYVEKKLLSKKVRIAITKWREKAADIVGGIRVFKKSRTVLT